MYDFTTDMEKMTEELALKDFPVLPNETWKIVSGNMNKKAKTWKGLTNKQAINKTNSVLHKANGSDVFRAIETSDFAMA